MISLLAILFLVQDPAYSPQVAVEMLEGRPWFTVRARNASAVRVLQELARASGRALDGRASLGSTFLTIDLVRRPLDQVLEFAAGSLGLRHELRQDAIVLFSDAVGDALGDASDELGLAWEAWDRAAARFPDSPEAAEARLSQGELSELGGDATAARAQYLSLAQDHPRAAEVGEALLRAGRISERLGEWDEAGRLFRTLASRETSLEVQASARLEWARTLVAQGECQTALQMLAALDASHPAASSVEETARALVRARALEARGSHVEALRELDHAEAELDELGRSEALELRARALTGAGLESEAARAWLLHAQEAADADRAYAYRQAAELALDSGDELAVLFVAREASTRGVDVDLGDLERRASEALGLLPAQGTEDLAGRIAAAERALREGALERATPEWETLFQARGALDEPISARISVGWARCVAPRDGVDAAVSLLVEERRRLASQEARRIVDVGAATLFEEASRFEEALDAYEGRYRP